MKPNSKSQARTKADSEQKDEDIFVCQYSRKLPVVCRLYRRTKACFNCVRGSLEASAGRKVLQVLASVLQVWWALANVCRLMRGNIYLASAIYSEILLLRFFSKTNCRRYV